MKNKGFATLVTENLAEKVRFENTHRGRGMSRLDVMMLQLVLRAAHGDSEAVRWVLRLLKETMPAPPRVQVHLYSQDENGNVINEDDGTVLGPLSDFPDLPKTSGPVEVPKEWLFPKKKKQRTRPGKNAP